LLLDLLTSVITSSIFLSQVNPSCGELAMRELL
jgi:hypothetical protein